MGFDDLTTSTSAGRLADARTILEEAMATSETATIKFPATRPVIAMLIDCAEALMPKRSAADAVALD